MVQGEQPTSPIRSCIPRLGPFHNNMSFVGSIGHLMAESGLREIFEIIYAPNAVDHMLSGKAISRAVRGDFIVDAALSCLLYSAALGVTVPHLQPPARLFSFCRTFLKRNIVIYSNLREILGNNFFFAEIHEMETDPDPDGEASAAVGDSGKE